MASKTGIVRKKICEKEFICTVWVYNIYIVKYKDGGIEYCAYSAIDRCSPRREKTLAEVINTVRRIQLSQQLGRAR